MADKNKKDIDLDSFIDPQNPIKTGFTIDPKEKMLGFAKLKVPAISPDIRLKIAKSVETIRENLKKL